MTHDPRRFSDELDGSAVDAPLAHQPRDGRRRAVSLLLARARAPVAVQRRGWVRVALIGVACFVLGVVTAFAGLLIVPNVLQKYFTAANTKARVDIRSLEYAAREFAANNAGKWPDDLKLLTVRDVNGQRYLETDTLPLDPWGREYRYEKPAPMKPQPRIYSLGRDGRPGGVDADADVDNLAAR